MKLPPRACRRAAAASPRRAPSVRPSVRPSLRPPVGPSLPGAGAARPTPAAARMLPPLSATAARAGRGPPSPAGLALPLTDAASIHSAPPARPGVGARGEASLPLSLVPSLLPAAPEALTCVRHGSPAAQPSPLPSFHRSLLVFPRFSYRRR